MAMKLLRLLPVMALLAIPVASSAQITNGDFENGNTGWLAGTPPNWTVNFLAAGGNPDGYAQILSPFGQSGGTACITQEFDCGLPDPNSVCTIEFDYRLERIDAGEKTGRVQVFVDGGLKFESPELDVIDWTHVSLTLECGSHEIKLTLNVDDGNHGWLACFDNVTARCESGVPTVPSTWGSLKVLYK